MNVKQFKRRLVNGLVEPELFYMPVGKKETGTVVIIQNVYTEYYPETNTYGNYQTRSDVACFVLINKSTGVIYYNSKKTNISRYNPIEINDIPIGEYILKILFSYCKPTDGKYIRHITVSGNNVTTENIDFYPFVQKIKKTYRFVDGAYNGVESKKVIDFTPTKSDSHYSYAYDKNVEIEDGEIEHLVGLYEFFLDFDNSKPFFCSEINLPYYTYLMARCLGGSSDSLYCYYSVAGKSKNDNQIKTQLVKKTYIDNNFASAYNGTNISGYINIEKDITPAITTYHKNPYSLTIDGCIYTDKSHYITECVAEGYYAANMTVLCAGFGYFYNGYNQKNGSDISDILGAYPPEYGTLERDDYYLSAKRNSCLLPPFAVLSDDTDITPERGAWWWLKNACWKYDNDKYFNFVEISAQTTTPSEYTKYNDDSQYTLTYTDAVHTWLDINIKQYLSRLANLFYSLDGIQRTTSNECEAFFESYSNNKYFCSLNNDPNTYVGNNYYVITSRQIYIPYVATDYDEY